MVEQYPFFVYGTLMPGQPNDHLWEDCIGRAERGLFRNGRLYDMESFPMLIEGSGKMVEGQVMYPHPDLSVKAYELLVQRLDNLENHNPEDIDNSPYYRVLRTIFVQDHQTVTAWVYLGRPPYTKGRPLINNGSWANHSAHNHAPIAIWWEKHGQASLFNKNSNDRVE
jgi:gamma-glutamylcyclotransferase (GGCT)/AIG2-like uncharacterized protein YtfP